jgi:nicotinamide mononucleotide transporter
MSVLEWIAAALGVLNVALIIRRSIWNFPVGLVMVSLYGFIFYNTKLYSDALLQIYFFATQIYGWWLWSQKTSADDTIIVVLLSTRARLATLASVLCTSLLLGFVMARYTDAALPWWDASIAAFSINAQLLLSWRRLENWLLWIAADIIAIGVYYAKGLYPTTVLYGILLVMACAGFVQWLRVYRQQQTA